MGVLRRALMLGVAVLEGGVVTRWRTSLLVMVVRQTMVAAESDAAHKLRESTETKLSRAIPVLEEQLSDKLVLVMVIMGQK